MHDDEDLNTMSDVFTETKVDPKINPTRIKIDNINDLLNKRRTNPYYMLISVLFAIILGHTGIWVKDIVTAMLNPSMVNVHITPKGELQAGQTTVGGSLIPNDGDVQLKTAETKIVISAARNDSTNNWGYVTPLGKLYMANGNSLMQVKSVMRVTKSGKGGHENISNVQSATVMKPVTGSSEDETSMLIDKKGGQHYKLIGNLQPGLSVQIPLKDQVSLLGSLVLALCMFFMVIVLWLFFSQLLIFHKETTNEATWTFVLGFSVLVVIATLASTPRFWGIAMAILMLILANKNRLIYKLSIDYQPCVMKNPLRKNALEWYKSTLRKWTPWSLGLGSIWVWQSDNVWVMMAKTELLIRSEQTVYASLGLKLILYLAAPLLCLVGIYFVKKYQKVIDEVRMQMLAYAVLTNNEFLFEETEESIEKIEGIISSPKEAIG
ncbi:MAG: hypothetical protein ACYC1M_12150 [Armatimonadota bacterium]